MPAALIHLLVGADFVNAATAELPETRTFALTGCCFWSPFGTRYVTRHPVSGALHEIAEPASVRQTEATPEQSNGSREERQNPSSE